MNIILSLLVDWDKIVNITTRPLIKNSETNFNWKTVQNKRMLRFFKYIPNKDFNNKSIRFVGINDFIDNKIKNFKLILYLKNLSWE